MTERWLLVAGYEGVYEVSDQGRVMAVARHREDGRFYMMKQKGQSIQNGYPCVTLYRRKDSKRCYVHRLVAEAFLAENGFLPKA